MKTITFSLSAHYASALLHGDTSSLSEQDAAAIARFPSENGATGTCMSVSDSYFGWCELHGVDGDVADFTFPAKVQWSQGTTFQHARMVRTESRNHARRALAAVIHALSVHQVDDSQVDPLMKKRAT